MSEPERYAPIEIRGFFRSHTHLPIWEVSEQAGIWKQLGMKVSFEFCDSSNIAEAGLFSAEVGFVSGNHTPCEAGVAGDRPSVAFAPLANRWIHRLVWPEPVKSVADLRSGRIADTT